ncbi:hypothetical protein LOK49_LG04G03600 [Camellia lanceoleosa]|uniref:Uncharacterized protein n=1 Tax=Camellia lanceoleosa TaxID=1840588 RepID=A0ACC0HZ24_9ERIC|nr:hypothetical protein LOK49_LG04G03600 [Camellia lanceoleosa]
MVKKEEDEGKGKEGKNLLERPKFKNLENGRFKCVETGHEVPSHARDSYAQSKRCRIGLIDAALARNKPPLNTLHQDPLVRSKLICKLIGDIVNKSEEHIWKHINGKRFLNMLEGNEHKKKRMKADLDISRSTLSVGNHLDALASLKGEQVLIKFEVLDEEPGDDEEGGGESYVLEFDDDEEEDGSLLQRIVPFHRVVGLPKGHRQRRIVATGRVERGRIKVGDNAAIVGLRETRTTTVTRVEMFQKILDEAFTGDNAGLLFRGIQKEVGGWHLPFLAGYRHQFYMRTTDVSGRMALIMNDKDGESKMVMPEDHVKMVVELIMPATCEQGIRFAIREGGKTVGAGVIQSIVE